LQAQTLKGGGWLARRMSFERLVAELDKSRMLDLILSEPEEFERFYREYGDVGLPGSVQGVPLPREPGKVVFAGMGGSAIVGDFVRSLLLDKAGAAVEVVRDFKLPLHAGKGDVLVAVSYSGNTAETLRCAKEGVERGCYLVAVTSGGLLERYASKLGAAVFKLPAGRPPRTALAPMLAAALRVLEQLNLPAPTPKGATSGARRVVEEFKADPLGCPLASIAARMKGSIPLIYAYQPYSPVGFRFKTQINENAKYHAFFAELPEADHNEIMGWEGALAAKYHPVLVRGSEEPSEIAVILDFWKQVFKERNIEYSEMKSSGGGRLSELLELLVSVDLASYVLALLLGVDPTPVDTISRLKKTMDERLNLERKVAAELGL